MNASNAPWWRTLPVVAESPTLRFILIPVCLLLLQSALRKGSPRRWALFTCALFIQAVLFPEALLFLAVAACVTVLWALHEWRRGVRRPFAPLLWCVVTGLVASLLFAAYLAVVGARRRLRRLFGYVRGKPRAHGSIAADLDPSPILTLARWLPLVVAGTCVLYFTLRWRLAALGTRPIGSR